MDRSPLGRLPAELRTAIYEYVLSSRKELVIPIKAVFHSSMQHFEPRVADKVWLRPRLLAITYTCRQAYNEARPIFLPLDNGQYSPSSALQTGNRSDWSNSSPNG